MYRMRELRSISAAEVVGATEPQRWQGTVPHRGGRGVQSSRPGGVRTPLPTVGAELRMRTDWIGDDSLGGGLDGGGMLWNAVGGK